MTDRKRHFGGRVVSNGQTRKPKDFSTAPVMPNPANTGSRDMFGGIVRSESCQKCLMLNGNTLNAKNNVLVSLVLPFEHKTFLEGCFLSTVPNGFP